MDPTSRFLVGLFLSSAMLGIGLQVGVRDIRSTLATPGLLGRSLLANFVLVPALGVFIVRVVPMPLDVAIGFLMLALAPGGLGALQFTSRAKGALFYAGALTLLLATLSVFFVAAIAGRFLPTTQPLTVPYGLVLGILFVFLALPLGVGVAVHHGFPKQAEKAGKVLGGIAALTFVAWVVYLMGVRKEAIAALGPGVVVAMLAFIGGSILIGLLFGGPDWETRAVLASASSMRNAGLCFIIATRSFPGTKVPVAILAFSALMVPPNLMLTLYSVLRGRRKHGPGHVGTKLSHTHA